MSKKIISGYWENWNAPLDLNTGYPFDVNPSTNEKWTVTTPAPSFNPDWNRTYPSWYGSNIVNFNRVFYGFLTLDSNPGHTVNKQFLPHELAWGDKTTKSNTSGSNFVLYDTMTLNDIVTVMQSENTNPGWNWYWEKQVIQAIQRACTLNHSEFIWPIGGWSDLTWALETDQIDKFVETCVDLLRVCGGDGIDFDWEHLSYPVPQGNKKAPSVADRRGNLGIILARLRKALNDTKGTSNDVSDKKLGFTTRMNAFLPSAPPGSATAPTTGEGIDIIKAMNTEINKQHSPTPICDQSDCSVLDWVNIMVYDTQAYQVFGGDKTNVKFTFDQYKLVLESFEKYFPKDKLILGFEPVKQMGGGVWEGSDLDKKLIDYVDDNGYGGVMFWAINETTESPKKKTAKLDKDGNPVKDKDGKIVYEYTGGVRPTMPVNGVVSQLLAGYAKEKFLGY